MQETPPSEAQTEAEPPVEVPVDGITPFAEEGAEVDADLLPVKLLKGPLPLFASELLVDWIDLW